MSAERKIKKSDVVLLIITVVLLSAIIVFCAVNWQLVVRFFDLIVQGKGVVKEWVRSLGVLGGIAIVIVLIFCYFFPFFSNLPLQIVCLMAYGIFPSTLLITFALAVASQILFLIEKNLKTFCYTKKQRLKQEDLERRIQNSSRNIDFVMILLYIVPLIPFVLISSIACRSNMKWWKYTLYNTLGVLPEVFITLLISHQITSNSSPLANTIILLCMIVLIVVLLILKDKMIYWIFKPQKQETQETQEIRETKENENDCE